MKTMTKTMLGCCTAIGLAWTVPVHAQAVDPVATTTEVEVIVAPAPAPGEAPETVVVVEQTTTPAPAAATTGAYDSLPPGGQKIARALFTAQTGPMTRSLDDIAAARGDGGWGQVFKQMRAEGAVTARNLGEVVSGRAVIPPAASTTQSPVVVSYGNSGTTAIVTGGKSHHGASAIVTADGGIAGATSAKVHPGPQSHGHAAAAAATATTAAGASHGNSAGKSNGNKHGK